MGGVTSEMTVLFLSAGRRVELIRLFQQARDRLGLGGAIIAADVDPLAPALQVADRAARLPRLDDPRFDAALLELCGRERVSLVFPLIDPDIPVLSRLKPVLAKRGTQAWVVDPEAAALCADKRRTRAFFQSLGLETPRAWDADTLEPSSLPYPLFIKPSCGSAGIGAYRVENSRELLFHLGRMDEPVVEECVEGPEITADIVCDGEGGLLGLCLRRRIEVRGGEVLKGVTMRDEGLLAACRRVATALPVRGPVTLQCLLRAGRPLFTEINARMGGGLPLAVAAGVDAPARLLAAAAGLSPPQVAPDAYEDGLFLTRCDESFFVRNPPPPWALSS